MKAWQIFLIISLASFVGVILLGLYIKKNQSKTCKLLVDQLNTLDDKGLSGTQTYLRLENQYKLQC